MYWSDEIRKAMKEEGGNPLNLKFGQFIVQKLEEAYPHGQYLFVLDAGCCGTYLNAQYLNAQQRRFLTSVTANQPNWLWTKYMHIGLYYTTKLELTLTDLQMHEHCWKNNDWNLAMTIFAKKDSSGKNGELL
jgi:hypothetical protein